VAEFKLKDVKGKRVFTTDGLTVGQVSRFELDLAQWRVRSLVVKVTDTAVAHLGLKKSLIASNEILIGRDSVKSVGDVLNLNVSTEMLHSQLAMPTSKKTITSKR
jgi:sporulation protein YlmC with PRC-barrel domain